MARLPAIKIGYKIPGSEFTYNNSLDKLVIDNFTVDNQYCFANIPYYKLKTPGDLGSSVFVLANNVSVYDTTAYAVRKDQVYVEPVEESKYPEIASRMYFVEYQNTFYVAVKLPNGPKIIPFGISSYDMKHRVGEIQFYIDSMAMDDKTTMDIMTLAVYEKRNGVVGIFNNEHDCSYESIVVATINLTKGILTDIVPDYLGTFVADNQVDYISANSNLLSLSGGLSGQNITSVCNTVLDTCSNNYSAVFWHKHDADMLPLKPTLVPDQSALDGIYSDDLPLDKADFFTGYYLPYYLVPFRDGRIFNQSNAGLIQAVFDSVQQANNACITGNIDYDIVRDYYECVRYLLCTLCASQRATIYTSDETLHMVSELLSLENFTKYSIDDLKTYMAHEFQFPDAVAFFIKNNIELGNDIMNSLESVMIGDYTRAAYDKLATRFNSAISYDDACLLEDKKMFKLGAGGSGRRKLPVGVPYALGDVEKKAIRIAHAQMGTVGVNELSSILKFAFIDLEFVGPYLPYNIAALFSRAFYGRNRMKCISTRFKKASAIKDLTALKASLVESVRNNPNIMGDLKSKVLSSKSSDVKRNALSEAARHRVSLDTYIKTKQDDYENFLADWYVTRYLLGSMAAVRFDNDSFARPLVTLPRFCESENQAASVAMLRREYPFVTNMIENPQNARGFHPVRYSCDAILTLGGLAPLIAVQPRVLNFSCWNYWSKIRGATLALVDLWHRVLLGDMSKRAAVDSACNYDIAKMNYRDNMQKFHLLSLPPMQIADGVSTDEHSRVEYKWNSGYSITSDVHIDELVALSDPVGGFVLSKYQFMMYRWVACKNDGSLYEFNCNRDDYVSDKYRCFWTDPNIGLNERKGDVSKIFTRVQNLEYDEEVLRGNRSGTLFTNEPSSYTVSVFSLVDAKMQLVPTIFSCKDFVIEPEDNYVILPDAMRFNSSFVAENIVDNLTYINARVNSVLALSDSSKSDSFFTRYTSVYEKLISLLSQLYSSKDDAYVADGLYSFVAFAQYSLESYDLDALDAMLSKYTDVNDLLTAAWQDMYVPNVSKFCVDSDELDCVRVNILGLHYENEDTEDKDVTSSDDMLDSELTDLLDAVQGIDAVNEAPTIRSLSEIASGVLHDSTSSGLINIPDRFTVPGSNPDEFFDKLQSEVQIEKNKLAEASGTSKDTDSSPSLDDFLVDNTIESEVADEIPSEIDDFLTDNPIESEVEDIEEGVVSPVSEENSLESAVDGVEEGIVAPVSEENSLDTGTPEASVTEEPAQNEEPVAENATTEPANLDELSPEDRALEEAITPAFEEALSEQANYPGLVPTLYPHKPPETTIEDMIREKMNKTDNSDTATAALTFGFTSDLSELSSPEAIFGSQPPASTETTPNKGISDAEFDSLLNPDSAGSSFSTSENVQTAEAGTPEFNLSAQDGLSVDGTGIEMGKLASDGSSNIEKPVPIFKPLGISDDLGRPKMPTFALAGETPVQEELKNNAQVAENTGIKPESHVTPEPVAQVTSEPVVQQPESTGITSESQSDSEPVVQQVAKEEPVVAPIQNANGDEILFDPSDATRVAPIWKDARDINKRIGGKILVFMPDNHSVNCGACASNLTDLETFCRENNAVCLIDKDCVAFIEQGNERYRIYTAFTGVAAVKKAVQRGSEFLWTSRFVLGLSPITLASFG